MPELQLLRNGAFRVALLNQATEAQVAVEDVDPPGTPAPVCGRLRGTHLPVNHLGVKPLVQGARDPHR